MNEISELLKGNDMQKDCAYHLLQYRYVQFPSILKSAKIIDDVATIGSFIESVAVADLMVRVPAGFHVERDVPDRAGGLRGDAVRVLGSAADGVGPAGASALRGVDSVGGGVGEGVRADSDGADPREVPESWGRERGLRV